MTDLVSLAVELADLGSEVIVTVDTPPTQAAMITTRTIPIVIAAAADPVGAGFVASLARPGGNVTGLSLLAPETDRKSLELFKQLIPKAERVAIFADPNNSGMNLRLAAVQAAAYSLAVGVQVIRASSLTEVKCRLRSAVRSPPDAVLLTSPIYAAYRTEVIEFASSGRVPLILDTKKLATEPGALFSYGADLASLFRRAVTYVDKILNGVSTSRQQES